MVLLKSLDHVCGSDVPILDVMRKLLIEALLVMAPACVLVSRRAAVSCWCVLCDRNALWCNNELARSSINVIATVSAVGRCVR